MPASATTATTVAAAMRARAAIGYCASSGSAAPP